MKISVIGGGTVGAAFAATLTKKEIVLPEHLTIVEKNEARCDELRRSFRCYVATAPYPTISDSDCILLAVKPQDFQETALQLGLVLKPGPMIISSMTGIRVETIRERIPAIRKVVRCMPNLAVLADAGINVCYFPPDLSPADINRAGLILSSCGSVLSVQSEDLMDAATAVSATGPGFLAYLVEEYVAGARNAGFSDDQARSLVYGTMLGTAQLFAGGFFTPEELIRKVATKAGTTEAALTLMKDRGVGGALQDAVAAALKRARELARSR